MVCEPSFLAATVLGVFVWLYPLCLFSYSILPIGEMVKVVSQSCKLMLPIGKLWLCSYLYYQLFPLVFGDLPMDLTNKPKVFKL